MDEQRTVPNFHFCLFDASRLSMDAEILTSATGPRDNG